MPIDSNRIPVAIPEAACLIALGPLAAQTVSAAVKARIEDTPTDTSLGPEMVWRHVVCTAVEAQDIVRSFQGLADHYSLHGDNAKATPCAQAVDNARHALRMAGISN